MHLHFNPTPVLLNDSGADKNAEFQLFLTRSKDVAQNLRLYTKRLINTRLGIIAEDQSGDCDNSISKESEEETTQDLFSLDQEDFPLVCTFDYFLRLLENLVRYLPHHNHQLPKEFSWSLFSNQGETLGITDMTLLNFSSGYG